MQFKVIHIEETNSTNQWLKDWLRETADGKDGNCRDETEPFSADEDVAVWTDYQTAGRGCGTNTWESERGKNLLFSVLLHPKEVPAAEQFILSMANALALRDTLADYVDDVTIKWPNDIYWKDSKICGTLIETTLHGPHISDCIIGTGINVNQLRFVSDAPNPVSLSQILGHDVDCREVLQKVLTNIVKYMELVKTRRWEAIRSRYRYHLYRLGEYRLYRFADGSIKKCKLVNVMDDGHLELLHDDRETFRLGFKEVQFII